MNFSLKLLRLINKPNKKTTFLYFYKLNEKLYTINALILLFKTQI